MTEPTNGGRDPSTRPEAGGLVRELHLCIRHRKPILINVVVVTIAAIAYSLLTPKVYEAHTSVLPATDESPSLGALTTLLRDLPIQGANLPGVTTSSHLLGAMVESRRIMQPVAEANDLQEIFNAPTMDLTLIAFQDKITAGVSDEGILHVRYRDKDPERAARCLNQLIAELNRFNVSERTSRSRQTREFIEERAAETKTALVAAENELRAYQEANATPMTPDQMQGAESIGSLIARRLSLRIELDAMRQFLDSTSPSVRQRENELRALEEEIGTLPEVGLDAVRLYRNLKVQEQLYLFLTTQLEQSRIDESRDLPVLQVLDEATPPTIRAWPRRKLIVLVAFAVAVVMGILIAHALDFIERERSTLSRLLR